MVQHVFLQYITYIGLPGSGVGGEVLGSLGISHAFRICMAIVSYQPACLAADHFNSMFGNHARASTQIVEHLQNKALHLSLFSLRIPVPTTCNGRSYSSLIVTPMKAGTVRGKTQTEH